MLDFLISFSNLHVLASFVAPIITGEIGVIFLSFLSVQNTFNICIVIFYGCLGIILWDSLWFVLLKTRFVQNKYTDKIKCSEYYVKLEKKIENFSHRSNVLILFISKLLIGSRVLTLIYLNMRKLRFVEYLAYNTIATFLWMIMLSMVGWFAGQGYYSLSQSYDKVVIAVLSLTVSIGIFYLIVYLVKKSILKKQNGI